jgi:hypothetical protein
MSGLKAGVLAFVLGAGMAQAQVSDVVAAPTHRDEAAMNGAQGSIAAHPMQAKPQGDVIMTPAQAKELLASVDEIMAFVAKDTALPGVPNVKRRLVTRDEVNKYLIKSFDEDESSKRLQRSEIVLKKFGLLNQDFDLRPFLLKLLTEQIAGYYDDKTKEVNLLNWIEPSEQRPVLAHELTHAVQDQKVELEKWGSDGFKGVSKTASEDANRVLNDEKETARQAVAEGQAMAVFVDYAAEHPAETKDEGSGGTDDVMSRAPLLLQRSLEFPYISGMAFEKALAAAGGKKEEFAGVLDAPPSSSYEILHPGAYLAHTPVPTLRLPDVHAILDAEYEPYDLGVMGELDVEMMATLFGGEEVAKALSPAWNGGVYYAAQRRSATAAEKLTTGSLGVMYFSRWRSDQAAQAFAKLYAGELGRKYSSLKERKADELDGEQVYTTDEGDVLIWISGKDMFVSEGYALGTARKLRDATAAVQGSGPVRVAAGTPVKELGLGTAQWLGGFGMIKAGMRAGCQSSTLSCQ